MKSASFFIALIAFSIAGGRCFADNGAVVLAHPLEGVAVDGDFSDWPDSPDWRSIERVDYADPPQSSDDFDASFCVGYDRDSIYIAVRVRDQSPVSDGTGGWDSQDGCSIYFDVDPVKSESVPIQFNFYGDGPPTDKDAGRKIVEARCQRTANAHHYEWRINIQQLTNQPIDLESGRVLGLDISLNDKDADKSYSWISWGPGTEKALSSSRLGDVLLVDRNADFGELAGHVLSKSGKPPVRPQLVLLDSSGQTSPLACITDAAGEFKVRLPAGSYSARLASSSQTQPIEVTATDAARIQLRTSAVRGQPTEAPLRTVVATVKNTRVGTLHSYGWADGLRWGKVLDIAQASDGSLWIAGEVGLAHFDGRSMTAFEEQDGTRLSCNAVAIDGEGQVWGGGALGIFRYHKQAIIRYTPANGLVSGNVRQLIPNQDGSLWIRTDHGIGHMRDETFTTVYTAEIGTTITSLRRATASRLWVGTNKGLIRLDAPASPQVDERWKQTRYDATDGLPTSIVRSLLFDSKQSLWIGTSGGLARFDGTAFDTWTSNDGLSHNTVTALAESADGRIFVGTNKGVDELWRGEFYIENRVAAPNVMYVDREQNVWVGDESLFRFNSNRPWHPWNGHPLAMTSQLGPRKLMLTEGGDLWVGTVGGVIRCQKKHSDYHADYLADCTVKRYVRSDGLAGGVVTSLLEDSTAGIWVGTRGGVSLIRDGQIDSLTVAQGLSTPFVTALAESPDGRIWIATSEGITILDRSLPANERDDDDRSSPFAASQLTYLTTMHGLRHNHVTALIADDDESMWIGSKHRPISRWHQGTLQHFDQPREVHCFLKTRKGDLFAGTADGLYQFDGEQWNHVEVCGKSRIYGLSEGAGNHLWIATSASLKVYDGFAVHTYTADDAMRFSCWDVAWDKAMHSAIVAGTTLAIYSPRTYRPPVSITGVSADQEYAPAAKVNLLSTQPSVEFKFHGVSFATVADAMRYRYRLQGAHDDWRLTDQSQVTYGALPIGEYTFQVEAIDRDLNYSAAPASISVSVVRDYRKTALWGSFGCAIMAVIFLSVTVVKRDRGIRRLNVELDQRVQDRTAKLEAETAENQRLQDQLLQTQKLDAVGTMASGIAHDFNNSLAAITGFAEVAKSKPADSGEFIEHILTAAKQAAGTTKNLLTFSKQASAEKVPRDLVQLVRETTVFLRKMLPTSIELSADLPDDEVWCPIDSVHLQQVLVNVAMNARDAMPDGGLLRISVGKHPARPSFGQLTISDNGAGMPDDVRRRIFDPFFTTKSRGQGTGLGMSIVHGIIEDHQGSIEIQSAVGQGTTVSISLPQCPPSAVESAPPRPVLGGHGETILVAEDRQDVQKMIVAQLTSAGFDVLTADDGQQALDILRVRGSKVALALLDIDLPVIDGKACLQQISVQYPHLPTVLMSGLSSVNPTELETPFLRKPFDRGTLLAAIKDALRGKSLPIASGVLVIDDDDMVRMSTKAVLSTRNVDVYLAHDKAEAIGILRKNPGRIRTVLLDWNLPQTDPQSLLQELEHVSPGLQVLVVSGDPSLQAQQVKSQGFSRLLRKPVSSRDLMDAVA